MNNRERSVKSLSEHWLVIGATGLLAVVALGVWAFAPVGGGGAFVPPTLPHPSSSAAAQAEAKPPLDVNVFKVAIYNPVPPPPPPQTHTVAEAKPLKLQLIGIVGAPEQSDPPSYKAALYDPDADELFILGPGEHIGATDHTVKSVAATSVEITDPRGGTHVLQLDPAAATSSSAHSSESWLLAPHAPPRPLRPTPGRRP